MPEATGRVGFERFIETWETSESVQEVCDKLEMGKPNAYARATKYRSEGIPLKKFTGGGGRHKVSVEEKLAILARVRGVAIDTLQTESEEMLSKRSKSDEQEPQLS